MFNFYSGEKDGIFTLSMSLLSLTSTKENLFPVQVSTFPTSLTTKDTSYILDLRIEGPSNKSKIFMDHYTHVTHFLFLHNRLVGKIAIIREIFAMGQG